MEVSMKSIQLHYSKDLVLRTVRTFWLRTTGWRFLVSLSIAAFCGIYLGVIGDRSWFFGAMSSAIVLVILFGTFVYLMHRHRALSKLRSLESGGAQFECDDANFRLVSSLGSSEMKWSAIKAIWRYPDFWLLFLSRGQYFTLPTADFSPEAREEILRCLQAQGIKPE